MNCPQRASPQYCTIPLLATIYCPNWPIFAPPRWQILHRKRRRGDTLQKQCRTQLATPRESEIVEIRDENRRLGKER